MRYFFILMKYLDLGCDFDRHAQALLDTLGGLLCRCVLLMHWRHPERLDS